MAPHSSTLAWKIPWTEKPGSDSVQIAHRHTERKGEMLSLSAKPVLIPGCTSESFGKHTHTHTHTQDQNQTKQNKLLSYVSHVRMVPDTIIG